LLVTFSEGFQKASYPWYFVRI